MIIEIPDELIEGKAFILEGTPYGSQRFLVRVAGPGETRLDRRSLGETRDEYSHGSTWGEACENVKQKLKRREAMRARKDTLVLTPAPA